MSYGIGQQAQANKGGKIKGKGTGTSDDIKKTVPSGSFIMPKDSTDAIGEENLARLGQPTDVNLSNGEFQLTPDQVHAVGVQALDQMKDQTHTPVDQPTVGFGIGGEEKPELFFANGGLVSPYPSADDIRKARAGKNVPSTAHAQEFLGGQQQQKAGQQARTGQTFNGQARTVNPPPSTAHAQDFLGRQTAPQQPGGPMQTTGRTIEGQSRPVSNLPATTSAAGGGGARTPGFLERAGGKALGAAKGLGVLHGISSMIGGAVEGFNTDTGDYATRMGLDPNADRGELANLGIRAAGVMSDVGNAASFGILGQRFPDKQLNQAKADLAAQQQRFAEHNAQKNKAPAAAAPPPKAAAQPNIQQQMNDAIYPGAQAAGSQAAAAGSQAAAPGNEPYQIKQQGNSFSYANPQAAAQARAQGVPELQSSGITGRANDPKGVANFMANTREMGASQEQIDRAIQQSLNGGQGFGIQYPDRPQRNDAQEAERQNAIRQISAPIQGARGMTSSQRSQLAEMQTGEDSRAVQLYNTDANNATSQANNTANNSANIAQTMMREQGSNERAVLGENGQNMRFGANLENDKNKFNREMSLTESKEGFGIRNAARVEKLNEMYDKAETDEQRQSIQQRINRLTGAKDQSGKDRYMTVGGGQEYNDEKGVMINRPQQIFDTQTGQMLNLDGSPAGGRGGAVNNTNFDTGKFKDGQVYQDPGTGQYYRWDAKSGRQIPVQQ